jgi:hypothetical protein
MAVQHFFASETCGTPLWATLFRILINENWAFPFRPDMKKARSPPYTN